MSPLYPFILNMWIMDVYKEVDVEKAYSEKHYINETERNAILATPKMKR
jgi:hypothetical protein